MLCRPMVRRLMLIPPVIATVVVGAFAANPAWARAAGLDVWNASELARQHREAVERHQELGAVDAEICRRIGIKESIATSVADGEMTLADATAQFHALNRARPEYMQVIRDNFPGATDEESTARNVIDYTLGRVTDPTERDRLDRRLHAELRTLLRSPAVAAE